MFPFVLPMRGTPLGSTNPPPKSGALPLALDGSVSRFQQGIGLGQLEAGIHDRVFFRPPSILQVSRCNDRAVGEDFQIGIPAVAIAFPKHVCLTTVRIVEKFHAVTVGLATFDGLKAPDPGDVVAKGRACLCDVAEGDDETSVGRVFRDMTIAGENGGKLGRRAPRFSFILAERDQGLMLAIVLAHQHRQALPIRLSDDTRLRPATGDAEDGLAGAPGKPAVTRLALDDVAGQIGPHDKPPILVKTQDRLRRNLALDAVRDHRSPG